MRLGNSFDSNFLATSYILLLLFFCLTLNFPRVLRLHVLCQIEIYKSFSITISLCLHFQLWIRRAKNLFRNIRLFALPLLLTHWLTEWLRFQVVILYTHFTHSYSLYKKKNLKIHSIRGVFPSHYTFQCLSRISCDLYGY